MFKKSMVALICVLALVSMAAAQDAKTVISNASKAMGYDSLKSIEYSGPSGLEGTAMGQAQSAAKGWPHFTLKNYSRYIDLNAGTRPADLTAFAAGRAGRTTRRRRRTRAAGRSAEYNGRSIRTARGLRSSTLFIASGIPETGCPRHRMPQSLSGP